MSILFSCRLYCEKPLPLVSLRPTLTGGQTSRNFVARYVVSSLLAVACPLQRHYDELACMHAQASVMYGRSRDVFLAYSISDCVRLIENALVSTPRVSLATNVRRLMSGGEGGAAAAQKLRVAHGMDDRHFLYLRVHALGQQRNWSELENLAKQRSPVGYLPFIEVAQRFNAPASVLEAFVARIPDATTRSQLFAASGLSAASAAAAAESNSATRRFPFFKVGGS